MKEPVATTIGVWVTPEQKELMEKMARDDDRSLSKFILRLILKEARRRKLIEKPARA